MKESILRTKAKSFSLHVIAVCDTIENKKNRAPMINQIIRSSTSIGANLHEAAYGCSLPDFINKLHISLKECYETEYWIEMLNGSGCITDETATELMQECTTLRVMLVRSINTAKSKLPKE